MNELSTIELENICRTIRIDILRMIKAAGSGHPGGSFSAVEILVELFFRQMKLNPELPDWSERDIFILSKGHACPALYAVMAHRGFFDRRELPSLRQYGSRLQGHPDKSKLPGLEVSAGSLGHGLSISCGFALGIQLDKKRDPEKGKHRRRVFCLLGDGELQEGSVWEAAMTAAHLNLSGLTAVVDRNHVQLDGFTGDIKSIESLVGKWHSFGWYVVSADGHDLDSLNDVFLECRASEKPSVIIAETVKGRGVSWMENSCLWHGKCPNDDEYELAMKELKRATR